MNRLKSAFVQLVAIGAIGSIIAFTFNAFSVNGINPFRKIADVPVIDSAGTETENEAEPDGVRFVSLAEMRGLIERGVPLIDARTYDEYIEGHIPGAILVDYYDMGRYLDPVLASLPEQTEIALYCTGLWCEDAELLARELYTMGYTRLHVFKGGFEEWTDAGLPVEEGKQGVRLGG